MTASILRLSRRRRRGLAIGHFFFFNATRETLSVSVHSIQPVYGHEAGVSATDGRLRSNNSTRWSDCFGVKFCAGQDMRNSLFTNLMIEKYHAWQVL